MLNRLPEMMPTLTEMVGDIGNPKPAALAKALGVSPRTVHRWLQAEEAAPRCALLAIFWLTRWGMSLAYCEAHNLAQMHAGMAACTKQQLEQARAAHAAIVTELEARLELLGRIGDFGAANDPAPPPRRGVPALPVIAVPGEASQPSSASSSTSTNHRKTARFNRAS